MSKRFWGAQPDEWKAFSKLALEDLRPVVSNPNILVHKSVKAGKPVPCGKQFSKSPSKKFMYQDTWVASGFPGWPSYRASRAEVSDWSKDVDLGFGLVANSIKAIDIDVDDAESVEAIDDWLCTYFDADLPYRYRDNSPRRMLIYRLKDFEQGRNKIVIPVDGDKGQVEFLFDRNFFVCCGKHHTGAEQHWADLPDSIEGLPVLDNEDVQKFINAFAEEFGPKGEVFKTGINAMAVVNRNSSQVDITDDLYQFVTNSEYFRGIGPSGEVYVQCPWHHTHSKKGSPSETVFFPKGLGGREEPGFKCMHTTHGPKNINDFLSALNYIPVDFPDALPDTERQPIKLVERNQKTGRGAAILPNLIAGLRHMDGYEFSVRYDKFDDAIYIKGDNKRWERMTDNHYSEAAIKLYHFCNIADPQLAKLRQAVDAVAFEKQIDSGLIWLSGIEWDGKDRTEGLVNAMSTEVNAYSLSCARYLMTSMAARLATQHPDGVQTDMSLVLASGQGEYKTTFIKALVPKESWYGTVDMSVRDVDTARMMRGKVVIELAELRGMMGRDAAAVRAWLTATYDEYVQKYKEKTLRIPRRCVFIGSTNHQKFLVDPTGNRRWLPLNVGSFSSINRKLDAHWVEDNRDQIWAQGYSMVRKQGIAWQDAQRLAIMEHKKFRQHSTDEMSAMDWIKFNNVMEFRLIDLIAQCRIRVKYPQELEAFLLSMGWREHDGLWKSDFY